MTAAILCEIIAQASADTRERAERASSWTAAAIDYQFGVTGYSTPAAMALHLGKGVCQDYAHILLTLLRLLNIPARYVSARLFDWPDEALAATTVSTPSIGETRLSSDRALT